MRRLFLLCLLSLPLLVDAASKKPATVPAPPDVSTPGPMDVITIKPEKPEAPLSDNPEAPEPPMPIQSGENMEADITIVKKGDKTIQEYRNNGVIYMVKIIPDKGPAYYMVDYDGDGNLEPLKNEVDRAAKVNMWKIFEWK